MPIPLPPTKEEQTSIATALSNTDALITNLEKLIAKKRNIQQGAMQQLLTCKKRLPGFSGKWEVKKLGDVCNFFSGGTPNTAITSYYGGDIPWITSSDLNQTLIIELQGRITNEGLVNSSAKIVDEGTLLFALYGATAGVTAITKIKAAINQAVLAIIPKSVDTLFLFYKISSLKSWLVASLTQGGQPNFSAEIIKSVEVSLPNFEEQQTIASFLDKMDSEIESSEKKLQKYKMIKQGMLQNLLTGKIRLT